MPYLLILLLFVSVGVGVGVCVCVWLCWIDCCVEGGECMCCPENTANVPTCCVTKDVHNNEKKTNKRKQSISDKYFDFICVTIKTFNWWKYVPGGNGGGIWWACRGCKGGRGVSLSTSFDACGSDICASDKRIEFDFGGFGGLGGGFEWCFAILWNLPFYGIYHFMEITITSNQSCWLHFGIECSIYFDWKINRIDLCPILNDTKDWFDLIWLQILTA